MFPWEVEHKYIQWVDASSNFIHFLIIVYKDSENCYPTTENLTGFVSMVNLGALWSDFDNTFQSLLIFLLFSSFDSADRHVSGLVIDGLQCFTHCNCVNMYVAMTLRMQRVGGCRLTPHSGVAYNSSNVVNVNTTQPCHLYLSLGTRVLNKMALPYKSSYSVFFQVLPEILSQMQPELPKECREPTRHAALSGRTTSFLLTLPN